MPRPKSLAAAAAAVTLLALVPVSAAAAPAGDPVELTCTTATSAACDSIAEVRALLQPLAPALELGSPVLEPLAGPVADLTALLSAPSIPAAELSDAATAVADQLSGPVVDVLTLVGVDATPIRSALAELATRAAEAAAVVSPAPAPAPSGGSAPASSGSAGGAPTTAASNQQASAYDAPLSSGQPLPTSGPDVPGIPLGRPLALSPLGEVELAPVDLPGPPIVEQMLAPAVDAVAAAANARTDESRAIAVVVALSTLVMAAGLLIDQLRKANAITT